MASEDDIRAVATHAAARLSLCLEVGLKAQELREFFGHSLGGGVLASHTNAALDWLENPARHLAFRDEHDRYRLTVLGLKATRAVLPLSLAAGYAQLLRDLLALDPSDQLLARWSPLDHLITLELLFEQSPRLRRFSGALAGQLDAWMEADPGHASLLYEEWIAGEQSTSEASQVLGSLGIRVDHRKRDGDEWARREAYLAVLRSVVLHKLGRGTSVVDLEHRWKLDGLEGIEERWRDSHMWLLASLAEFLDLRCFYYHLREDCSADAHRVRRVKELLRRMRTQVIRLRGLLNYCSPLGPILHNIRQATNTANATSVGIQSIRRLEEAGIRSVEDLSKLREDDLARLGVRRDLARQIETHVVRYSQ